MTIRIFLVDDHKLVREGLKVLLEKEQDIKVVGEAENGRSALKLLQKISPNVVIMDITMPDLNGVEATRQVLLQAPNARIIALSMHSDKRFIMSMLGAGASGYLPKDSASGELVQAIRTVAQNRTYLSPSVVDVMVKNYFHQLELPQLFRENSTAYSTLTSREREVLQLLSEGKTAKEIARSLSLSVKTIETYRQQVMHKLNIHSIAELTKYAIREGLTSLEV